MKKFILFFLMVSVITQCVPAQVKIGGNPQTISPGSILELESTSRALTLPRMTTIQMEAIASPMRGMIVFNIDSNCIYLYKNNNVWASISNNISEPTVVAQPIWPYITNDLELGTAGNKKGIVAKTGNGLTASGEYSHAEGLNAMASGNFSLSYGNADTATATGSIALGTENRSSGSNSLAVGQQNKVTGQSAVALGQENTDSGWASLAMGLKNRIGSQVNFSNALGFNNSLLAGLSGTALGEGNTIKSGKANAVLGISNIAAGNYNNLLGNNNETVTGNANLLAGEKNKVNDGNANIVLGYNNQATGNYNHISGNDNVTAGGQANLLSGEGNTILAGNANALFGINNRADANYAAAFGKNNVVFYQSSVALGQNNKDSGWASVTGGLDNIVENNVQYSASFGFNNISTRNSNLLLTTPGAATFSAGANNVNAGFGSMALGGNNRSSNLFSLAANHSTVSNAYGMSAFGHYNDTIAAFPGQNFNSGEMLFSIGNGTDNNNRRNSFTMLRNGFTSINASATNGANVPRSELDVKGTGAIIVPVGTAAQRPVTPVEGMIRLCSDCGRNGTAVLQGYDGTAWVNL